MSASQLTTSRLKADLARTKAAAAKAKEEAGASAAAAAGAAASESAARARAAVAVGARQDAEKVAAGLRERLEERERETAGAREVSVGAGRRFSAVVSSRDPRLCLCQTQKACPAGECFWS